MNATANAPLDLAEALREIYLMAGFDPAGRAAEPVPSSLVLGVTSPGFGDGKSTVAMALASSLSRDFATEVTLVDADFHTHSIARTYQLEESAGLSDVLDGTLPVDRAPRRVGAERFRIVTAGKSPSDPVRAARSEHLNALIDSVRESSTYVVLDLPAILHSTSATVLARRCDAVVVVVRAGKTSTAEIDRTLRLLRGAHVAGVILNRKRSSVPRVVRRALGLAE